MAKYEIQDGVGIIPEGTTEIEREAFAGCTELESITIPDSVTKIGYGAFRGCTGLNSITIPDSVTEICMFAFRGCTGLTSIVIGNSVTEIRHDAFLNCTGLTSIVVSGGNKVYDSRNGCNAIIETETNKLIIGCATTIIPDSVTEIDEYAFKDCTSLTNIDIPNSVTKIGYDAFYDCTGLSSIVVSEGNKVYDSRNGCNAIIETATNRLIVGCKNTIIPNSVTAVGGYDDEWGIEMAAFKGCIGLISIVVPESVTEIGGAFRGCTGLKSISILGPVKKLRDIVFSDCTALETVTFGAGIKKIEKKHVFADCKGLKVINVPAKKVDYYKQRLPEELHGLIVELPAEKKAKKK